MESKTLRVRVIVVNNMKVLEIPQIVHSLHVIKDMCSDKSTIKNLDTLIELILK